MFPHEREILSKLVELMTFPKNFVPQDGLKMVTWPKKPLIIYLTSKVMLHLLKSVKSNQNVIATKFFASILEDPLLKAKLCFFQSFAATVEPILTFFQSDAPLSPLLYESLYQLLQKVFKCFITKHVVRKSTNLCDINIFVKKKT